MQQLAATERLEQEHSAAIEELEQEHSVEMSDFDKRLRHTEGDAELQRTQFIQEHSQLQHAQSQHAQISDQADSLKAKIKEWEPIVADVDSLRNQLVEMEQSVASSRMELATRTIMLQSECKTLVLQATEECELKCQVNDTEVTACTMIVEEQLNVFENSISELWEDMQLAEASMQEAAELLKKQVS